MKTYLKFFKMTLMENIQYRTNLIINLCIGVIPLVALVALWLSIYKEYNNIGGYKLKEMITYIIIAKILEQVLLPEIQWNISSEIKSGSIVKYLIKPINFFKTFFSRHIGEKTISLILSIIPLLVISLFLRSYIIFPSLTSTFFCLISIFFAILLYYSIYYIISLFTFWFTNISAFFFTTDIILELLSGAIIPLALFTQPFRDILNFLPFSKLIYFPVNIYLNRISTMEIIFGFFTQVIWIIIFNLIGIGIWRYGIRKYDPVGG